MAREFESSCDFKLRSIKIFCSTGMDNILLSRKLNVVATKAKLRRNILDKSIRSKTYGNFGSCTNLAREGFMTCNNASHRVYHAAIFLEVNIVCSFKRPFATE